MCYYLFMNFNYKTAFFLSLGILIFSWILFAGYLTLTLVTFMDAGKSNLITNHDCADGDYCALNPENMPDGGWTGMDDKTIPPSEPMDEMTDGYTPGSKVDASTLYQNIDFQFRFEKDPTKVYVECPAQGGNTSRIGIYSLNKNYSVEAKSKVCDYGGVNQSLMATSIDDEIAKNSIKNYSNNSSYKSEPFNINGVKGTRYYIDTDVENNILGVDFVVVKTKDFYYEFTSDFYDRNVFIW